LLQLEDFLVGFLVGVLTMLLVGWLLNLNSSWVRERDAFRKPQSVGQSTSKTPAQLYRQSLRASTKLWVMRIAVVLVVWLMIEMLFPEFASDVKSAISSFFQGLFG
jgi:hypothetical protein